MNLEELKKYDGKDGRPAYVACRGKVYDVTDNDFWTNGIHMGLHKAGEDMTAAIDRAPHGFKNIEKFPVVGTLDGACVAPSNEAKPADDKMMKYQKLYAKYHPHPMNVHFPMGILSFAFFTQIISIILGGSYAFTAASVIASILGTFFVIPSVLTGLLSLYVNYFCSMNKYMKRKISLSALLFVSGVIASCLGISILNNINIFNISQTVHFGSYTFFVIIMFPMLLGIGYNGGKLTWPDK